MSSDKELAQRKFDELRDAIKATSAACSSKSIQEIELRNCLSKLHEASKGFSPYWSAVEQERQRQYQDDIAAINERALKLVRKMNPRILTVKQAMDVAIPVQERHYTRSSVTSPGTSAGEGPSKAPSGPANSEKEQSSATEEQSDASGEATSPGTAKQGPDDTVVQKTPQTSKSQDEEALSPSVHRKGKGKGKKSSSTAAAPGPPDPDEEVFSPPDNKKGKSQNKKKSKTSFIIDGPDRLDDSDYPWPSNRRGSLPDFPPRAQHRNRASSLGNRMPPGFDKRGAPSGDLKKYGYAMCNTAFPEGWSLPSASEFRRIHSYNDVPNLLGRPGIFGFFEGEDNRYPAWRKKFIRVVHVQDAHVAYKCEALDQSVATHIRERLFEDLGDSLSDYVARISRLEHAFGGDEMILEEMAKRIRALRTLGPEEAEKIEKAVFSINRVLEVESSKDKHVLRMMVSSMRLEVLNMYKTYCWDWELSDLPSSVHRFFKRYMWVGGATARGYRTGYVVRYGEDKPAKGKRSRKKSVKPAKIAKTKKGSSSKPSTDNYQFFKKPVSKSSTESSSDTSSSEIESSSDSDDDGELHVQKGSEVCAYCQGSHDIFRCDVFCCQLTAEERRAWVVKHKRCLICLKPEHAKGGCGTKRGCRFCGGKHNSIVHTTKKPENKNIKSKKNASSESEEGVVHSSRGGKNKTSLTTFVALIADPETKEVIRVNALADGGADHIVLSSRAAKRLGLWKEDKVKQYQVKGHGGSSGLYKAQTCCISLLNDEGKELRQLKVKSYDNPCGDLQIENWHELRSGWKHLETLPLPKPVGDGVVDLILGSSALDLMEAVRPAVFGPPGGPVAKLTRLGWIVGGRTAESKGDEALEEENVGRLNFSLGEPMSLRQMKSNHALELNMLRDQFQDREALLKNNLKKLWGSSNNCCRSSLRNSVSPAIDSTEDVLAREKFQRTFKVLSDRSLEVGLLWRDKTRPKNNWESALQVFLSMEKRMRNTPGLWEEFDKNIQDWLEKKYARLLDINEKAQGYFIPTFMVVREDKSTTKYRLIVNGKFEFDKRCINHYLLSGPNVMNRLQDVLIRFRYHKYVVTCDVSNMFLRIKVPASDSKFLRFFYRDSSGTLKIVEMTSHAFGLTQSPFVVMEAVRRSVSKAEQLSTSTSDALLKDSIVDDVLTGCKNFEQLKELAAEIKTFYASINMHVHKWATNSPGLRAQFNPEEQAGSVNLGSDLESLYCSDDQALPSIKCLGILWHPASDQLQFFHDREEEKTKWTMRKISSRTSRLFDPLGLMSPLILEGKLILQSLWREKVDWDDEAPAGLCKQYNLWLRKASASHLSHIPRRVKSPFRSSSEKLIIFTDASSQAQAAAAYLWCSGQDVHSGRLWAAKQKISSLNRSESISRLELEGAVMGIELAKTICRAMRWNLSDVLFFTDSTTVLWWLRTTKELDVFVGNRVCRILDNSDVSQWFHVRTKQNPADIPTRGLSGKLLADCKLWWEGPDFFSLPYSAWPEQPPVVENRSCSEGYRKIEGWLNLNLGSSIQSQCERTGWPDEFWLKIICKFSNLEKGMRVGCLVLKFLGKFSRCGWRLHPEQSRVYMQNCVFRAAQFEGLAELRNSLLNSGKLPPEYKELNPQIDNRGVIRLGGRLRHARRLPYALRCPVVLSGKHPYSRMLLVHLHSYELRHCGGKKTLMAESRWKVWISGLARLSKDIVRKCVHCVRSTKRLPAHTQEAPLHFSRIPLKKGCAFSEIGIDMAGPFYVKHGRTRAVGKRFLLLFSCCWTRALSLEVMDSASTESCVFAFLRHCNVFGYPRYVNSDRGTNLAGLDRHYKEQWSILEEQFSTHQQKWPEIKWNFNPPYSPRFTGHVEIMVKVTKNCLRKILGQNRYLFRDEELQTLTKVAQGYANLRPLSEPSDDPNDMPPLIPADFLMTGSRFLGGIPEIPLEKYSLTTRKEMLGKVTRDLWETLTQEYILELQKYHKSRGNTTLKTGDIVLILDKTMPSGRYHLGRIVSEKPGPDGRSRSFVVKSGGKLIDRSLMTLAPLNPQ